MCKIDLYFDLSLTLTSAPCGQSEFACSNGLCIDSEFECDAQNQCGDASDEANCADDVRDDGDDSLPIDVIVGCSVAGFVFLVVLAIVAFKVRAKYRAKTVFDVAPYVVCACTLCNSWFTV